MKKRLFWLPLFVLALAACDPISVDPSSETSSTPSSSETSESSSSSTSTEVPPQPHEHSYSSTWSKDDTYHWHECTVCGDKKDVAAHTYNKTENEEYYIYTCTVCGHSYQEKKVVPVDDPLNLMNEAIKNKTFKDPFEVRDYLLSTGDTRYDFYATLPGGERYGYSLTHEKVVEHKNGAVTRPTEYASDVFVPFTSVEVTSFGGLYNVINQINAGEKDYSTIKLSNNITQTADTGLIQFNDYKCIEIDLQNHSILAPNDVVKPYAQTKWFTLQFLDKTNQSQVYIHNGTIEANRRMEQDCVQDDACCLSLVSAKSFRLDTLNLVAKNGTECVGDLSQYIAGYHNRYKKVYMDHVNMEAPLKAVSIVGGDWSITNSNINGMVVIEGGKVLIEDSVVDAKDCIVAELNKYESGFTNDQVATLPVTRLNGNDVNTNAYEVLKTYYGALTFNDAVCVISRRNNVYSVPNVTIRKTSLSPVVIDDNPAANKVTGYGLRYWDIENSAETPIPVALENNTYPEEDGNGFGGTNLTN